MKSTEDYINKVYEKFEETQKNHIYYKTVKLRENNTMAIISCVAICMILLFTITYTKFGRSEETVKNLNNHINYVENLEDGTKTYVQYISVDVNGNFTESDLKYMIEESNLIAIISDYDNKVTKEMLKDENLKIYTNGEINIEKVYKGDKEFDNKKITYSEIGGRLLVKDFESKYDYDWITWEKNYLNTTLTDEERGTSYFEQIPTRKAILESDAKYLVFLDYDENLNSYALIDSVYGALEYDSNTNMVKNPITGEFEEFDWSLLENQ